MRLLLFTAPWSPPSKSFRPVVEAMAEEAGLELDVIDADTSPEKLQQYGVKGLPWVVLFNRDEVRGMKVGACPREALREWLTSLIPVGNHSASG